MSVDRPCRLRRCRWLNIVIPSRAEPPPPDTPTTSTASSSASTVENYERLGLLGHGHLGSVYKVRDRRDHSKIYALKVFNYCTHSVLGLHRLMTNEMNILGRMSGFPQVVHCHSVLGDVHSSPGTAQEPALLLEYMDVGDFASLIRRLQSGVPPTTLPYITHELLQGLFSLHSHLIVHLDIKPSNILINSLGHVKISDLGVARLMSLPNVESHDTKDGTFAYMSPERITSDCDGYPSDVWSLGITLMELFLGFFPLLPKGEEAHWVSVVPAIHIDDPPKLPPDTETEELSDFLACCIQKDPDKRLPVENLMQHPLVNATAVEKSKAEFLNLLSNLPEPPPN